MYHSAMVTVKKGALAAVTALLLASHGAFLVPLLAPLHVWAARRSGPGGRVGWGLAAGLGAAATAWAATYVVAGERQPAIWALPTVVGLAVAGAVFTVAAPRG